jgi:hypothetical protein
MQKTGRAPDQITYQRNCLNLEETTSKVHTLERFKVDKNQIPQEWETEIVINIQKKGQKANEKTRQEFRCCL